MRASPAWCLVPRGPRLLSQLIGRKKRSLTFMAAKRSCPGWLAPSVRQAADECEVPVTSPLAES